MSVCVFVHEKKFLNKRWKLVFGLLVYQIQSCNISSRFCNLSFFPILFADILTFNIVSNWNIETILSSQSSDMQTIQNYLNNMSIRNQWHLTGPHICLTNVMHIYSSLRVYFDNLSILTSSTDVKMTASTNSASFLMS